MKLFLSFRFVIVFTCLFISFGAFAKKETPIKAFIEREKKQTSFIPVQDIWNPSNAPLTEVEKYVTGAQLLTLNTGALQQFMLAKNRAITLSIPSSNGNTYEIELARFDIFSNGFQAAENVNGVDQPYNYSSGLYYRGAVKGVDNSLASFSFFNSQVYGIFSIPGVGNIVVVPNTLNGYKGNGQYLVYNDMDLKERPAIACSTDQLPELPASNAQMKNVFASCKDVEFYIKADYEVYTDKASNMQDVLDYITAAFNEVSTIYRNEQVYISIRYVSVNTTTDVYQTLPNNNAGRFLDSFSKETQNNLHDADLAMLLSSSGSTMGGIAWRGTICQPYSSTFNAGPYSFCNLNLNMQSFPTYSFDVEVMAHEPGHNIGVRHTHWCGWPGGAIDGCYTPLEDGPCAIPSPQYPPGGGTIMSYCHLQSVGINFTNGFGPLPGDALRNDVSAAACAEYLPHTPVMTTSTTMLANRECTDGNGVTWYLNDNNNTDEADDRLILGIAKGINDIGTVDDIAFDVMAITFGNLGSGNGTNVTFPTGMPGTKKIHTSINRYWKIIPVNQPGSQVEVVFPFTKKDIADIDGSVVGNPIPIVVADLSVYSVDTGVDPNPLTGFTSTPTAKIHLYSHGTSPTSTKWASTSVADTLFAHFRVDTLNGGTVFYTYYPVGINDVNNNSNISFYPNPAKYNWNILLPDGYEDARLLLYTIEGKQIREQQLQSASLNSVDATSLSTGLYYYRINSSNGNYTGILQKL